MASPHSLGSSHGVGRAIAHLHPSAEMKQRGSKTNWDFQQEKHFGDGFKALKREAMLPARLHRMIDELRKWMPFTPSARARPDVKSWEIRGAVSG